MKRPELVSNRPDNEEPNDELQPSAFPIFDRLRRERIAEEAGTPAATPLPDPPAPRPGR